MNKKKNSPSSGKRIALMVLCIVLAVVLVVMLGGTIYVEHLLGKMNYVDSSETQAALSADEIAAIDEELQAEEEEDADFTGPVLSDEDVDLGDGADVPIGGEDDNIVNILLIGQDTRTGKRARSDSMILVTFNKTKNTITLTSFMRDLYVSIPGYKNSRINAAYAYGGMTLLDETLYQNFGIHVDGNVEVDFAQFADIIDLLGGVEMELTRREATFINQSMDNSYCKEGVNLLNGLQALMHARNRKDVDGDFSRTNRQRELLTALIDKYKNSDITTMLKLLEEIFPMVTTDLTSKEVVSYVTDLFPMLTSAEIVTQHVPVDGGYYNAEIGGAQVLVPYMDVNIQALMDSLVGVDEEGVG